MTERWTRRARFEPKNLDTLRDSMKSSIGRVFDWQFAGTSGDDEPYPGQTRWTLVAEPGQYADLPDDARWRWAPDEDLEDVT